MSTTNIANRAGDSDEPVAALARALDILEYLEVCEVPPTLSEIAQQRNLPRASAHRLMETLKARGYVTQNGPRDGFLLGARVLGIAARAQTQLEITRVALKPMQMLAEATGEACLLCIRSGRRAVNVVRVPSPSRPDGALFSRIGGSLPLHASAVGKVLLAYAPDAEQATFFEGRLNAYTPQTITRPEKLRSVLEKVHADGVAYANQEYKKGLHGIAAPVFDSDGEACAALTLPLVSSLDIEEEWEMRASLCATADVISRALGFSGPA